MNPSISLADLPYALREALGSDESNTALASISDIHNLPEDARLGIAVCVGSVLMGRQDVHDLPKLISTTAKISMDVATEVSRDVVSQIISPVALDLEKFRKELFTTTPRSSNLSQQETADPLPEASDSSLEETVTLRREDSPRPQSASETLPPTPEELPHEIVIDSPILAEEAPQSDEDTGTKENVIAIPTITVTKPPRFIPLKDLKQGSVRTRPAPEGIPAANTMPSFPKPSRDAIHTLKSDAKAPVTPARQHESSPQVLSRIEPTPERIASTLTPIEKNADTTTTPKLPEATPQKEPSIGDPYREPVDMK